ncbi:MAG: hypothetical protein COU07_02410 [Candidatus Harrisonbacteria bacterium CG10_big_fil_rev_8_21_14_0_10_40_38]|uniref:Recombinase zinc beta ribbon domain-containing protein n=1 Tax=Candidatus Harrisonbacteria bacterium CG10_big_fil_rev_8_21_14_0_10_40_38 TaxID=1974583 RepID=A0A2H0UTU6_9BACT|nr:MAG: hypothetical protein COU07_02410 [Candidatus Harrisonbacteria bacterium CG10_big_fil_rev_8_21_14_0_10_40_38]
MFTAQYAHGNGGTYRYYRCTKKKGACSQGYLREDILVFQLKERLQTISLCEKYTDWMLAKINEWEQEEIALSQSDVQNLSTKIKASEERMEKLVSAYLDGDIPKASYLTRKDEIMRSLATLKAKRKDFERGENKWVEPLREWVLDTKQANFLSLSDNFSEIASFVKKIGTNHVVRDKSARFSVPAPSQFVAERRARLLSVAPSARRSSVLNSDEVSICARGGGRTHTSCDTRF